MGQRNVVKYDDGRRTLRFRRGKTNVQVEIEIEIVGELAAALEPFLEAPTLHPTFIRRPDDKPYSVDGISSMFRRHVVAAGVSDFGLRDLRIYRPRVAASRFSIHFTWLARIFGRRRGLFFRPISTGSHRLQSICAGSHRPRLQARGRAALVVRRITV